jgi:hypothetical protein
LLTHHVFNESRDEGKQGKFHDVVSIGDDSDVIVRNHLDKFEDDEPPIVLAIGGDNFYE